MQISLNRELELAPSVNQYEPLFVSARSLSLHSGLPAFICSHDNHADTQTTVTATTLKLLQPLFLPRSSGMLPLCGAASLPSVQPQWAPTFSLHHHMCLPLVCRACCKPTSSTSSCCQSERGAVTNRHLIFPTSPSPLHSALVHKQRPIYRQIPNRKSPARLPCPTSSPLSNFYFRRMR